MKEEEPTTILEKELNSDTYGAKFFREGIRQIELGNFYNAKHEIENALSIHNEQFKEPHPIISEELTKLGIVHYSLCEILHAHRCFFEAFDLDNKIFKKNHPKVVRNLNNLGCINKAQGRIEQAIWLFERALMTSLSGNPDITDFMVNLGLSLVADDKYKEAKKLLEEATKKDKSKNNELKVARDLMYLGYIQKKRESSEKVIGLLKKSINIFMKNNQLCKVACCWTYMGDALESDNNTKKLYYSNALKIFKQLFDIDHMDVKALEKRMTEL